MQEEEKSSDSTATKEYFKVANGVWGMKIVFVNIYMIKADHNSWVLVDTGLKYSAPRIIKMAAKLFGWNCPPKAIILTHGHFDHRGALDELLKVWDVPVYAHYLEIPYLTGQSSYPPPDPTVGGGLMSYSSFLYPSGPIDISDRIQPLDERKTDHLPFLKGWRLVHTPGHAPGHISLFMDKHRVLIAGDAFVTTKQESAMAVASQKKIISGPPKYFTYDWDAARSSVEKLIELDPKIAASGHGKPFYGLKLSQGLQKLHNEFDETAVPHRGRYIRKPARVNEKGVQFVPPTKLPLIAALTAFAITAATVLLVNKKKDKWPISLFK